MAGLLRLARPLNCAMAAVGVGIGGIVAVGSQAWGSLALPLVLAGAAAAFFTAGGNALNDLYDRETDRVNHPKRPLPSGQLRLETAKAFIVAALFVAAAAASFISIFALPVVAINAALTFAYEAALKAGGAARALATGDEIPDGRRPRGVPRRCRPVNVYASILERRRTARLHMALLEPDTQTAEDAASLAGEAGDAGTDAIMVGGSTGVTQGKVDDTVLAIKGAAKVPVILFPASAGSLSPHADALFFMSLLNSKDPRLIVGEQRLAAPVVKAWGLETIPMAYLVVEPGMRAGEVGHADLIPRKTPFIAIPSP